jgi:hypothetical protein
MGFKNWSTIWMIWYPKFRKPSKWTLGMWMVWIFNDFQSVLEDKIFSLFWKVDPWKVDGMDFQFVLEDKTETICG